MASAIMVQGTASNVGKSVLTTALCRYFHSRGLAVAPFKAQNMSLNSYATADGGEIGRAQGMQAEAAGVTATVDMNPILLKPLSDGLSQLVVLGEATGNLDARGYHARRDEMLAVVAGALERLAARCDVLVIEGAGSPAEVNLREQDIVNMPVARLAGARVLLVGDIDRGGVFASLVGTLDLLDPADRELVGGLVINRFRGDRSILEPGVGWLQDRTGLPVFGVLPFLDDLSLDDEDSMSIGGADHSDRQIRVAVVKLPRIANFSDFRALAAEPDVSVAYVTDPRRLDNADLILIPGTKNTLSDLEWLRDSGLADKILGLARSGRPVIGVCGGYQMLGRWIEDPSGVEGKPRESAGLGLLPVITTLTGRKVTEKASAGSAGAGPLLPPGADLTAYEIHAGLTIWDATERPAFTVTRVRTGETVLDGAMSADGNTAGTYLHGLFDNAGWRRAFVNLLRERRGLVALPHAACSSRERQFDLLQAAVERHLDMEAVTRLLELPVGACP